MESSYFHKDEDLTTNKSMLPRTIAVIILFTICGFFSAYIFHSSEKRTASTVIYPGLFYTSTTILLFIISRVDLKISSLIKYYIGMYATYLAVYYLTFITFWFGFLTGILTGGLGAVITFMITDRFVKRIVFDRKTVFFIGALAFLINDIFLLPPIAEFIEPIYIIDGWVNTVYAGTFLIWQVAVGTKLIITLRKRE